VIPRLEVVVQRLMQVWLRRKLRVAGVSITRRLPFIAAPIVEIFPQQHNNSR
jgi:hypothetical protein